MKYLPLYDLGALLCGAGTLHAANMTFGSGANEFTMEFVEIGNAGNAADDTGYGAVGYGYQIGTYEVREDAITKANAAGSLGITKDTRGVDRPATSVSWNEAARFVNWLNTSEGYAAAYKFEFQPGDGSYNANADIQLWAPGDAGYDASNPYRNSNAIYVIPSEDEWYKAAYYDAGLNMGLGGYYDYATGSDTAPTATAGSTTSGEAVYNGQAGPADVDNAGGLSPYGTMGQNGNVWEWGESAWAAPNDSAGESRGFRGGSWSNTSALQSLIRGTDSPTYEDNTIGFRVAVVPEPSRALLSLVGIAAVGLRRRRA